MSDLTSLKDLKEAFVTGHNGTSRSELILVCLSAPIGVFLYLELKKTFLSRSNETLHAGGTPLTPDTRWKSLAVVEALVLLLPMAICQTKLLYPWGVSTLMLELILAIALKIRAMKRSNVNPFRSAEVVPSERSKLFHHFLTSYRATVSYLTFVAILAVDFHVFPRRFAKTETSGYGLMDLGAGSFVVSAGLVSRYARRNLLQDSLSSITGAKKENDLLRVILHSVPLVILGCIRLLTNKGLDYQEHVSEYGVHWNFFFTLSMVNIFSCMLRLCIKYARINNYSVRRKNQRKDSFIEELLQSMKYFLFPFIILLLYQSSLSFFGLQDYIENAPRRCNEGNDSIIFRVCNLFAANREGILGCFGYLSLYCMSEEIAAFCLWSSDTNIIRDKQTSTSPTFYDGVITAPKYKYSQHELEHLRQRTPTIYENDDTQTIIRTEQKTTKNIVELSLMSAERQKTGRRLLSSLFVLILFDYVLSGLFQINVSRRSTNASFVIWTLEFNVIILLSIWGAFYISEVKEKIYYESLPSQTFSAVNRNGLVIFLLANLMTGAVNLSINTLEVSDFQALFVIFCYLCSVGLLALLLDKGLNLSIKLN